MRTLLIDAGNSRIKWAVVGRGRVPASVALPWTAASLPRVARRLFARTDARALDAVWIASVAGPRVATALARAARNAGAPSPRFVRTTRRAGGVVCGYRNPARLGVDRWLTLIAARELCPRRAVCIVSIGTAMTIDLLDAAGRHHGGAIVPGPGLMVESLLSRTALIRRRAARSRRERGDPLFAADTRGAVTGGSLHACAALVPHALSAARRKLGMTPRLLLSGGAAPEVARLLGKSTRLADDLVLRGLAVLARTATS